MLPTMPKNIYSAVGNKRKFFRDDKKERAKHYEPKKHINQLLFNDVKLTPKKNILEELNDLKARKKSLPKLIVSPK